MPAAGPTASPSHSPIAVAVVDDYDVVLAGVARMLDPFRDRVVVAELDANEGIEDLVDIALYDCFAQPESDQEEIGVLIKSRRARRVAVYTWNFHPHLIDRARRSGRPRLSVQDAARPSTSSPPSRQSTPARSSSASRRPAHAALPARTGPDVARDSPTARPRFSP